MKKIEFGELRVSDIARKHIQECLDSNWVTMGSKVKLFEQLWCNLFNYKHAKAVSSGTSAGMACCMALYEFGAQPGDEVIIPALSFIATANAVRAAGFVPKFVDIRKETMNIDEELIEAAITPKTRAIKAVNLMGRPAELDKIRDIAKKYNLLFIVDGCESYGCRFKGKFALDYADMETSSHYVAHLIVAAEMGMVSSNDPKIDGLIESIRSHGREKGSLYFDHKIYGLNFKTSDLHASIGLGEIDNFWKVFEKRHANVKYLRDSVRGFEEIAWFTEEDEGNVNCPHGFSITLKPKYKDRIEDFKKYLDDASIHWKRNFGSMPHHGAFAYLGQTGFPNALYVGNYGLHVGCHYWLSDADLEYMGSTLKKFLSGL